MNVVHELWSLCDNNKPYEFNLDPLPGRGLDRGGGHRVGVGLHFSDR